MEQYAAYLRKSRADIEAEAHGEGETLVRHERILLELAKKMQLSVIAVYREIVSGESIDARPEVQKLLAEVEQGIYAGVLVVDVDRLARGDTVDQGVIARAFRLSNTKIITPKKVYDPTSEYDEEYFEFELFMARREYKIISRRIQRGRIASVNDGKFIGSTPPYGYDKVKIKNAKGYTLAPNDEAEVVRTIFRMYLAGSGMTVIANALDDMHIKPRNRDTWSKSTISDILSNPVYIGKIRWSYRPDIKLSINGKVQTKRKVNENCYYVDGLHEPLVSAEDFDKAQELRKNNRRAPVKASLTLQNPLTGLVYCKKCGAKMTRLGQNSRNKYDCIKCMTKSCDCVSAPIYLVEQLIIESLRQWLFKYRLYLKNNDFAEENNSAELKKQTISNLETEIQKIDSQIAKTYDFLEQGIYTTETFVERNKTLSERKTALENEAAALRQSLIDFSARQKVKYDIIPRIENVLNTYHMTETAEEKNKLLKSVISRVNYYKDTPNRRGQVGNANFTVDLEINLPGEFRPIFMS